MRRNRVRTLCRVSEAERFRISDILRIPEIRAAMLGTFVIMLGYGILSPVLPNYAKSFGVGYDAVGLLISSFSFARLVSDPFVGKYIDRYGERAMSTLGAVWVGVSSFAAALAPTFPLLVLFRALGGIGSALFFASLLSFLLRAIPSRRTGRVMSVYYASFNIGFIAGGPLGGRSCSGARSTTPNATSPRSGGAASDACRGTGRSSPCSWSTASTCG